MVSRQRLSQLLTDLLDEALPSAAELVSADAEGAPAVTLADRDWHPFGLADEDYAEPDRNGIRWLHLGRGNGPKDARPKYQSGQWLRGAMIALGLLAAAAAVVSFDSAVPDGLRGQGHGGGGGAGGRDPGRGRGGVRRAGHRAGAAGQRALGPRALNVAAVATSIGMNYLAAGSGWRDAAIWMMPSVAYAVASDRLIAVVRASCPRPAAAAGGGRWPTMRPRRWPRSAGCCCGCCASP